MIRYTLQAELYGLNNAQRQQAATAINDALVGESYVYANVEPNYVRRGETLFMCEISDFSTRAAGDKIFNVCRSWASTRASDSGVTGEHSYVRLAEKNSDTGINLIRRAESPGWAQTDTTVDTRA